MSTTNLFQWIFIFKCLLLINGTCMAQFAKGSSTKLKFDDFEVKIEQKKVNIEWSTDASIVTNYFEVQKSNDGTNFKTIFFIFGADPKQADCSCYGCFDKFVRKASKHSVYRVVHVGLDGICEVSGIKRIDQTNEVAKK